MDIAQLMQLQHEFDRIHGWDLKSADIGQLLTIVSKDLVGMMGELGEFSNLVKKLNLWNDGLGAEEAGQAYARLHENLAEELVDTFVYLIRIATHMNIDLSDRYLRKLAINKERYRAWKDTRTTISEPD